MVGANLPSFVLFFLPLHPPTREFYCFCCTAAVSEACLAPKHSQGFIISYLIVERLKEKQNCIFHSFKKNLPHFFHFQAFQKDRQNESMPEKEIFLHSHVSGPGKEWAPSSTALQRPLFSHHFLSYVYFCGINYHQIWSQGDT